MRRKRLLLRKELNAYENAIATKKPDGYDFQRREFLKIHKEEFKKFREARKVIHTCI